MKSQLHKAFFLLLILSNTFVFVGYFEYSQAKIKKQLKTHLKQGVNREALTDFEFSPSEIAALTWIKKKEFKIGSNYYDIVWKKTLPNGKILLSCINDTQETQLFKHLTEKIQFALSDFPQEHPLKVVFSVVQQKYLPAHFSSKMECFPEQEISGKIFSKKHVAIHDFIRKEIDPPRCSS